MGVMDKFRAMGEPRQAAADPAVFGSELALRTEWTSIGTSSASFCSHRLRHEADGGEWRFAAVGMAKAFFWIAALGGVGMAVLLLSGAIPPFQVMLKELPFLYVVIPLGALTGIGIGIFLYRKLNPYIVFDWRNGAFYRAEGDPRKLGDLAQLKTFTPFREIGALQILEKFVRGSGSNGGSYLTYELNLVTRDGKRVNVISHGGYRQLAEDAGKLAELLRVPLWDVKANPRRPE